MKLQNKFFKMI